MKTYETTSTVADDGEVRISSVPFLPGTEVQVVIAPRRVTAAEFAAKWKALCEELRRLPGIDRISDEDVQHEVDAYRAGR